MNPVSDARLGAAVSEMSLCAIYLLSADGRVLSWNRGARQIKGWEERDITGLHFSVFYDDKEREAQVPDANLAIARERGGYSGEGWRLRRDGSVFRASVEIEYLHPRDGDPAAFIKIVRDISRNYAERTALNSALAAVRKNEVELASISQLLDEVFSHTPCGLILCDAHSGAILRTNPAATQLTWIKGLIVGANFRSGPMTKLPDNLLGFFSRGLDLLDGKSLCETLSSADGEPEFSLRLTAERLTVGSARDIVLFTLLDISTEYQAAVQARHQALHDPLTGLLNRRGLMSSLGEFLATETACTVMIFDIDRFKSVNDVLGHPVGDALLQEASVRLLEVLRDGDILARTGGDEFVAVCPGIKSLEIGGDIASRLSNALRKPFVFNEKKVISGCSIGGVIYVGGSSDVEDILAAADIALYEAKSSGRNRYTFYTDVLASKAAERFSLENDLRNAVPNGELQLFYQPIVDSISECVVAYEALLRWHHPVRGEVPPSVFIPLAEETGLIHDIGAFALNLACSEVAGWLEGERVAVNLSPRQFRDPQLAERVKQALEHSGLPPDRLELEITESALLENEGDNYRVIQEFKAMGIHIVLDDFGIGFSSLSYLRTSLFSKIKIDRSFIHDLHSDAGATAIVGAVLKLCQQLGLDVTAEGVEKPEQAEWLRTYGCSQFQGYLFGFPAPYKGA
ncbi:putative bifunctional diguanylate cyclase/phosphodiesterase [Herbaspirillum camelliae]|uniref:putative bifunctional diguanylate cyclase/phosphodiesterase n=1 Tax=Herbaspirillum camelliae TaxID=1892903 RepID=UPI000949D75A|nr:bifunctional diguanylate cyclase/phosphodiesterase [Herbaspirillum camelliae]